MLITLTDNSKQNYLPKVLFGTISVIFGICIYYFLPLGLMMQNFQTILNIFLLILLGMMFGLTMFVTNVSGILEVLLVYALLFWETPVMRTLLRKNLSSHKSRNFLTSIIYALTLGCIIFLLVSANLQVQSVSSMHLIESADLMLDKFMGVDPKQIDPILRSYSGDIKDFGYMSSVLEHY